MEVMLIKLFEILIEIHVCFATVSPRLATMKHKNNFK